MLNGKIMGCGHDMQLNHEPLHIIHKLLPSEDSSYYVNFYCTVSNLIAYLLITWTSEKPSQKNKSDITVFDLLRMRSKLLE